MRNYSEYALIDAFRNKDGIEKIPEILDSGEVDINKQDYYGEAPLLLLVTFVEYDKKIEFEKLFNLFLKHDVNLNVQNNHGETALIISAYTGYMLAVEKLIEEGADWNIINRDGEDFLELLYASNKTQYYNIVKKYNEKYKDYLIKRESNKYNL